MLTGWGHRRLRVLGKPALAPRGWAHTRLQPVHLHQGAAVMCARPTSGSCIQPQPRRSPDTQPRAKIYPPSSPQVNPDPDPQCPAPHWCRQSSIMWNCAECPGFTHSVPAHRWRGTGRGPTVTPWQDEGKAGFCTAWGLPRKWQQLVRAAPPLCKAPLPRARIEMSERSGSLKVTDHEAWRGSKLRARDQNPGGL